MNCNSQTNEINKCIDRETVVAGSFYPENPKELKSQLEYLFAQAENVKTYNDVVAIIAPHAGYVFSGKVAASNWLSVIAFSSCVTSSNVSSARQLSST